MQKYEILDRIQSPADVKKIPEAELPELAKEIRRELNFTSLMYHRLDDMLAATGVNPCKLCTYCWNGRE